MTGCTINCLVVVRARQWACTVAVWHVESLGSESCGYRSQYLGQKIGGNKAVTLTSFPASPGDLHSGMQYMHIQKISTQHTQVDKSEIELLSNVSVC